MIDKMFYEDDLTLKEHIILLQKNLDLIEKKLLVIENNQRDVANELHTQINLIWNFIGSIPFDNFREGVCK